jgi:hypothetical protein
MTLQNFEEYVDEVIVRRGDEYFDTNAVIELEEIDEGRWSALVEGTEDYEVRVSLKGDVIVESSCDCPFDHGPVCKHEVAVYYAIREHVRGGDANFGTNVKPAKKASKRKVPEVTNKQGKKTAAQEIDEVIEKLGPEGLVSFVREYALEERGFRKTLLANAVHYEEDLDEEDFRDIIRAPINDAADFGYGDYRSNVNAFSGIDDVMRMAESFLKKKLQEARAPERRPSRRGGHIDPVHRRFRRGIGRRDRSSFPNTREMRSPSREKGR